MKVLLQEYGKYIIFYSVPYTCLLKKVIFNFVFSFRSFQLAVGATPRASQREAAATRAGESAAPEAASGVKGCLGGRGEQRCGDGTGERESPAGQEGKVYITLGPGENNATVMELEKENHRLGRKVKYTLLWDRGRTTLR